MKNRDENIIVSIGCPSLLCIKCTMTGKVSDVTRTGGSSKPDLHFDYDAMGQRIAKTVTNKNVTTGDKFVTTYYVRDPQGNVLAVYEHKHGDSDNGTFTLAEQHLYGASRLGMRKRDLALNATNTSETPATYYVLTNHLGNVMAVISDEASTTDEPTIVSLSDYYPYGMTEPGRSWNAGDYRFGYTGHEKENDLAEGVYTTEYRLLDARLGRWLSVDPVFHAGSSSYNYCSGNPVAFWDPNGKKDKPFNPDKDLKKEEVEGFDWSSKYNCHFFAWCTDEVNPAALGYEYFSNKYKNKLKWEDEPPEQYMKGYIQLDPNDPNIVGDRVLYYCDVNENGVYDPETDVTAHSAIVAEVDDEGNTTIVIAKCGDEGVEMNHPRVPGYYECMFSDDFVFSDVFEYDIEDPDPNPELKRAYFRKIDE